MKKENNKISIGLILFIVVIVIGVGISFAYFAINVTKDKDSSNVDVVSGKLDVDFETDEYINNESAKLIDDTDILKKADKTVFSVARSEESSVEKIYYNIYIDDISITDNLKSEYFKWELYGKKNPTSSDTPISSGDFSEISDSERLKLSQTSFMIDDDTVNEYTLYIWVSNDEDTNQNDLLMGEFSAKVSIDVTTE